MILSKQTTSALVEFDVQNDGIYLNHAAIAPWPRATARAVAQFAQDNATNGPIHYAQWQQTESALRRALARLLGVRHPEHVSITHHTSEGLNIIARGLDWSANDNIVLPSEEFALQALPWTALAQHGVEIRTPTIRGSDDPETVLLDAVDERTRVLAVSHSQYADGLTLDLARLGGALSASRCLLVVDAIQSAGNRELEMEAWQVDAVCGGSHKWLCAPEGIGYLYLGPRLRDRVANTQFGWRMGVPQFGFESDDWQIAQDGRRFEYGSPAMIGIVALSASLEVLFAQGLPSIRNRLETHLNQIEQAVADAGLQRLSPEPGPKRGAAVAFRARNRERTERLFKTLRASGIYAALRQDMIRWSPHYYQSESLIAQACDCLRTGACALD